MRTQTYTVTTANAYAAKEYLKKAGFEFNAALKQWINPNFDAAEWTAKYCDPSYAGRKNARINAEVRFSIGTRLID